MGGHFAGVFTEIGRNPNLGGSGPVRCLVSFVSHPVAFAAAGSLLVCKIAGAAARAGLSLEEAEGRGTGPGAAGGSKEAAFLQST